MYIPETDSTNSLMHRILRGEENAYASCLDETIPLLYTGYQTAGRGQSGNGWESERDKNLLFTYLLQRPNVSPAEQFKLNILAAVMTHSAILNHLNTDQQNRLSIKWPNDIYYDDRKIAGILVENSLSGADILYSITGVGININQERWIGNAPNPISLKQIIGRETTIDSLMETCMRHLVRWQQTTATQRREYYMHHLYRRDGYWPYVEREVSTTPTMNATPTTEGQFKAHIEDILPTGELLLRDEKGILRTYHFKQVRYVL